MADKAIKVICYFVNLNPNLDVKDFGDFEMSIYRKGNEIASGSFSINNAYTVNSMGT